LGNINEVPLAFDHHEIMGLAIKLVASMSEATTSGGFGSGLLLRTSHV
jgi:hypothetical protein